VLLPECSAQTATQVLTMKLSGEPACVQEMQGERLSHGIHAGSMPEHSSSTAGQLQPKTSLSQLWCQRTRRVLSGTRQCLQHMHIVKQAWREVASNHLPPTRGALPRMYMCDAVGQGCLMLQACLRPAHPSRHLAHGINCVEHPRCCNVLAVGTEATHMIYASAV
jgi:hypothetical protein